MESNLPATTDQTSVPAAAEPPVAQPQPVARPRQNVTTGLFPIALAVLVVVFLALGFWTLMATTGGSGL